MKALRRYLRAGSRHLELYRAAGSTRRVQVAVDLSEATRATALAGIRRRYPDASETQIRNMFLKLVYNYTGERPSGI